MRILFVVHQFRPEYSAGTETMVFNIARSCQRSGHEVAVLTAALHGHEGWSKPDPCLPWFTTVEGLPVHALPNELIDDPLGLAPPAPSAALDMARRFLAAQRFDVVHVAHAMRMGPALRAVAEAGLPYVVTLTDFFPLCHRVNLVRQDGSSCDGPRGGRSCASHCPGGHDPAERFDRFRAILAAAEARISASEFQRRQVQRAFPELGFELIPHGVDLLRATAVRRPTSPAGEAVRFGFLGTVSAAKGPAILAAAFAAAGLPHCSLEIVGPPQDRDDSATTIAALAQRAGNILLRPAVGPHEIYETLSRFDVLCIPSQVPETYSLVLHEACALGIPAIVSDLGAPAELVRAHACGWTVPAGDTTAWADALRRLAADEPERRRAAASLPLPMRVEEEAFFYDQLFRRARRTHAARRLAAAS